MTDSKDDKCCPSNSTPASTTKYNPKGKEIDLNGLKCYTNNGAADNKKSVIVFYDIFGYDGGRTKQLCDQIASAGYYVILPDIYHGEAWPADKPIDGKLMEWLKNFPWNSHIDTDVAKVMTHLTSQGVDGSVGCLGFCAGAFSVFHLCQQGGGVKCGASCHPSVQIGSLFDETPEGLAGEIKCPQLVYSAGNDLPTYKPEPAGEVYQVLQKKFGNDRGNDFKEFSDMTHGWVSRGDISDPKIAEQVSIAMDGVLNFFSKYL